MSNDFYKTLEEMEDMMEEAARVPFSKTKCILDSEKFFDLLDDLKKNIPEEMKKSKELLENKDTMMNQAKDDSDLMIERAKKAAEQMLMKAKKSSDSIIERAKAQAETMVNEQEVLIVAKERAAEIIEKAKNDSMKMKNMTISYIDDVVTNSERSLQAALTAVQKAKQEYNK